MASKRDQIKMSGEEVARFLSQERVMNVATIGREGWPHVIALWYVMRNSEPWIYTYGSSQKVRNLERDPRAALLVESGREYAELRGVMLRARAAVHRELETVAGMAEDLFRRYHGGDGPIDDATRETLRAQAAKRVAVQFEVVETVSWDHAKLQGTY